MICAGPCICMVMVLLLLLPPLQVAERAAFGRATQRSLARWRNCTGCLQTVRTLHRCVRGYSYAAQPLAALAALLCMWTFPRVHLDGAAACRGGSGLLGCRRPVRKELLNLALQLETVELPSPILE
ncbi:hypothetical protein BDZ91DRAFT_762581 [Kalaharituber pfeilii]|nr:hypothetical protein BDZ91DRAFT_762581 [Kalaharituber pfeilii]